MRYRNRIKLAPGININLSKTGISTTVGPRGASVNIGKSGAYLNTGIPGTGLYDRTKISSSGNKSNSNNSVLNKTSELGIKLDLNENYEPQIQVYDKNGKNITSQEYINKVKRTAEYKENLKKIYIKHYDLITNQTADFTDLHKHIIKPITKKDIQLNLDNLKLLNYEKQKFDIVKPTENSIEKKLISEAKIKFNSILFWKNKNNRKEFVRNNLIFELRKSIEDWETKKESFEKWEQAKETELNADYLKIFEQEKKNLQANLDGTEEFVLVNFETILKEIDIKPEFFIDFEYDEKSKTFLIDLDLPEIEHLPKETASILQSGKLSVKNKTEKQLREEYAKCVTGLGLLVSGISFMASVGIEFVKISAYTQRIDKKDGNTKDDYIYSIVLDRENFSNLNYQKLDPISAFRNFTDNMELSQTHIFKTIEVEK